MTLPTIQPISAEMTHELRQRVLRPRQPIEEMAYPGDHDPATIHIGAINDANPCIPWLVIGIVSLYREPMPEDARPGDWRLRGMAVDPTFWRQGIGAALVAAGLAAAQAAGARRVWCNARTRAVGFYKRQGFTTTGDPFHLPGIGEHYVMWIALPNQSPEH